MYILQERTEDAKEIFEDVYASDKWQRGLYELGLDAYDKHEQRYVDTVKISFVKNSSLSLFLMLYYHLHS